MNEFQGPTSLLARPEQTSVCIQRILFQEPRSTLSRVVEGSDGVCYRAKFLSTSDSNKRLINQWLDSFFLRHLGVSTTRAQILNLPRDIARNDSELYVLLNQQTHKQEPMQCLGLPYPAHPEQTFSFGFLPRRFWGSRIANPADLATTFVLDQLLGMNHFRNIVFTRDRPCHPNLFRAYMIANQDILGGSEWKIESRLNLKLYCNWHPYSALAPACWLEALDFVGSRPLPDCQTALAGLPAAWLKQHERSELEYLFEQLQYRQQTLSEWIQIPSDCLQIPAPLLLKPDSKPTTLVMSSPARNPALTNHLVP